MVKKNKIKTPEQNSSIQDYIWLSEFRKPLFNLIINSMKLPKGSKGLDAGCGIGFYTKILAETVGAKGNVIGIDISEEFIDYAKKKQMSNIQFKVGDINSLQFKDDTFDWIWSADTVWPGPKELGCPAENPTKIVQEFYRVIKPCGSIILLFWSSQKLLPGYPLLETRLNTTSGATAPFISRMNPIHHIMNSKYWLEESGFKDISAKTFIADINAPFDKNTRKALNLFFQMFWGEAESQISKEDWDEFKMLSYPDSKDNILNNQYYYGFYTYTVFRGQK